MKYLYLSHLGGIFILDEFCDNLYCEECGDSDEFLGEFETLEDFWDLIKDACNINGSGGLSLQGIYPDIVEEFDLPFGVEYDEIYGNKVCVNSDKSILNAIHMTILKERLSRCLDEKEKEQEAALKVLNEAGILRNEDGSYRTTGDVLTTLANHYSKEKFEKE